MRVLIIGAGLGGLCLAHGLRRAGVEVLVFEKQRSKDNNSSGYGIHIDVRGKRALQNCLEPNLWAKFLATSTPAGTKMSFRDPQLRLLAERDDSEITGAPATEIERRGIGRQQFRDILLEDLDSVVYWNKTLTRYKHCADGRLCVYFEDETFMDGDVLVGADGSNSRVRKQYLPHLGRIDLAITAIAGRCALNRWDSQSLPPYLVDGSLNNIVPRGTGWMFTSSWNLPATSGTGAERHIVWAYVVPQSDNLHERQQSGHELQEIVIDGIDAWSLALVKIVRETSPTDIMCIPLRTMPLLEKWTPSNVTLMGDAIHNMTPMAGAGANTALRDAEVLACVLGEAAAGASSLTTAVVAYEQQMREYANEAIKLSRRNAENASSGRRLDRLIFRLLLLSAQASSFVMRQTLGRSVASAA